MKVSNDGVAERASSAGVTREVVDVSSVDGREDNGVRALRTASLDRVQSEMREISRNVADGSFVRYSSEQKS